MIFREGQIVVHPAHGPARIESISPRTVRGQSVPYVNLTVLNRPLKVCIPTHAAEEVGIRYVLDREGVDRVLEQLRAPSVALASQWSRRMKDLESRASSGLVEDAVVVTRELVRKGVTGRATTEGQLLASTRTRLATEMAIALDGLSIEAVEQIISDAAVDGKGSGATSPLPDAEGAAGEPDVLSA